MARGGARPGAGRKKGSRNTPKLQLTAEPDGPGEKPTAAQRMAVLRRQVVLMVADDMPREKIAAVMNMEVDRLEALFARELDHGKEILRAEVLSRLDAAGDGGSVSADRALEALTSTPAARNGTGKKESAKAAAEAAMAAGGKFAAPRPPARPAIPGENVFPFQGKRD